MLNGSRGSETGWLELGKACVSVTVETYVNVVTDHSGGLVDVVVSIIVSVIVSVIVVSSVCVVVDNSAGKVVGTIKVDVTGTAVLPEPGMTRFLKAT